MILDVGARTAPAASAPSYQVSPDHAGFAPTTQPPGTPKELWTSEIGPPISSPLIADGRLFVITSPPGTGARLHAFNSRTGALLWSRQVSRLSCCGIAYEDQRLFVVDSYGLQRAISAIDGRTLWITPQSLTDYGASGPPVAENGIVYLLVGGFGGTLYARDASDGRVLWTKGTGAYGSMPAVGGGLVFDSTACEGAGAYDAQTGSTKWSNPRTGNSCWGANAPVLADSELFIRDDGQPPEAILSTATGGVLGPWPEDSTTAPAFSLEVALFLGKDGTLYARDRGTGRRIWRFGADGSLIGPPLVVGDRAVIGSESGHVYWLDLNTGALVWTSSPGSPIIEGDEVGLNAGEGLLAAPTASGIRIFSYENGSSPAAAPASPPPGPAARLPSQSTASQGGAEHGGALDGVGVKPPLTRAWHRDVGIVTGYPLVADGSVFSLDRFGSLLYLRRLSVADGSEIWAHLLRSDAFEDPDRWRHTGIAYDDGRVFVSHSGLGTDGRSAIAAFAADTGTRLWSIRENSVAPLVASDGVLYASTEYHGLRALDAVTGHELWASATRFAYSSGPTVDDELVYVYGECDHGRAYDRDSGDLVWSRPPRCSDTGGGGVTAAVAGDQLYAPTGDANGSVLDARTGLLREGVASRFAPAVSGGIRVVAAGRSLLAERVDDGRILWEVPLGADPATAPLIVDGQVWVAARPDAVHSVELETGVINGSFSIGVPFTAAGYSNLEGIGAGSGTVVVASDSRIMAFRTGTPFADPPPGDPPPSGGTPPTPPGAPAPLSTEPETFIDDGPRKRTNKRRAIFRLTSDHPDARFECRLDRRQWRPCEPRLTLRRLSVKKHRLKARAVLDNSVFDSSPAEWVWRIRRR